MKNELEGFGFTMGIKQSNPEERSFISIPCVSLFQIKCLVYPAASERAEQDTKGAEISRVNLQAYKCELTRQTEPFADLFGESLSYII